MLNLYDRVTGIFNEILDSRLLTVAIFALIGYCSLFTQRKFPMRWMIFVLFGMILLAFVTLTARTPGQKTRVRFHKGMAGLWLSLIHIYMCIRDSDDVALPLIAGLNQRTHLGGERIALHRRTEEHGHGVRAEAAGKD